jgi:ribonuclease Z
MINTGKYNGNLNIYCNDEVEKAIRNIYPNLFPKRYTDMINKYLNIITLNDGDIKNIAGRNYTFFDVKAKGNKLYGFKTLLDNNEKLVFLGDETCNPEIYNEIINSDYVMHEAFCLDREQDIFNPYEKHHSTVKSV